MLSFIDLIVILLYFLVLCWVGYNFLKKQKKTKDFFKGGKRIPAWAAGLSIFGTALSPITFIAVPAKTFSSDWSYFFLNISILLVAPIIMLFFIPLYRNLGITSAYEYLEKRFNNSIRLIGSVVFIIFQIGRMGIVIFLPAVALNLVSGDINIFSSILLMGIVSLIYTLMGGIEAVIWTDVIQVMILLGGALLSLIFIVTNINGGISEIIESGVIDQKFNIVDKTWSLNQPTFWVVIIGGFFANLITYGTDQTIVQRYLVTKSKKEAIKGVWINAIISIPATLIFFFLGTALFVFFKNFPKELNDDFIINDAIFPWFIVSQLPIGVSGILIAAIFAAAMSSLSSSMNASAATYVADIHSHFNSKSIMNRLKVSRYATLIFGVLGILFAIFLVTTNTKSLWDEFQRVLGLVIGSLGGVFLLGIMTKKANSDGVLIGIILSFSLQILLGYLEAIHLILFSATGVISCFIFGYLASLFFEKKI